MKFPHFPCFCLAAFLLCIFVPRSFAEVSIKDVETAFMEDNFDQAKTVAQNLLEEEQNAKLRDELQFYIGLCDLRLGDFQAARSAFGPLTKLDQNIKVRDKAYLGLFDAYYIDGDYAQALDVIKKLKKISPDSEFASLIYLKLARVHLKLAKWIKARKYLRKITDDYPNSMEAHVAKQLLEEEQYFAVQVGAFIDRQRAEKLTDELKRKGEYAYVVETVDQRNRTFYRVRVGQLVRLENAEQLKVKLSKDGYPTQIYP